MKRILCVLLALTMVFTLAACGGSTGAKTETKAEPAAESAGELDYSKITIGYSLYNLSSEYFQKLQNGATARCEELGINLIIHNQNDDATEMVTGCENMIAQGIDALLICPCKAEAITEIVNMAHEAGIPVIVTDVGGGQSDYDLFIRCNSELLGKMAAEYMLKLLAEDGITSGEFACLKSASSNLFTNMRVEGFIPVMEAAGFTCVESLHADGKQDLGYNAVKDILAVHPDLVCVYSANDLMAMGAANAIEEAGLTGKVHVIGCDNLKAMQTFMAEGKVDATFNQDPEGNAAMGVDAALTLLAGGTLDYDDPETRTVFIQPILVPASEAKVE